MRKILIALFFLSTLSLGQNANDTITDKKSKEIEKKSDFIDENANGIDDKIENLQTNRKQKRLRDKFIDLDGDGICDTRQGGVGIRSRHGDKQNKQGGQKRLGHK